MFGWIQKKLKGNKGSKRSNIPFDNVSQERCREEFIDWPHVLLAIGTFGNNNNSNNNNNNNNNSKENMDERSDLGEENLTPEEVSELGKEIGLLDSEKLMRCIASLEVDRSDGAEWPHGLLAIGTFGNNNNNNNSSKENVDERSDLGKENLTPEEVRELGKEIGLLDREKLMKCIASLEVDRSDGAECCEGSKKGGTRRLQHSRSDIVNKKSLTFLLKKVFVCRSRLASAGSLNLTDQVPESRFEKILRAINYKKIHPQSCSPKGSAKKYLKNRSQMPNSSKEDEEMELDNVGRWDKTDSEYIVLEI